VSWERLSQGGELPPAPGDSCPLFSVSQADFGYASGPWSHLFVAMITQRSTSRVEKAICPGRAPYAHAATER
jgi:hypothetical protein